MGPLAFGSPFHCCKHMSAIFEGLEVFAFQVVHLCFQFLCKTDGRNALTTTLFQSICHRGKKKAQILI